MQIKVANINDAIAKMVSTHRRVKVPDSVPEVISNDAADIIAMTISNFRNTLVIPTEIRDAIATETGKPAKRIANYLFKNRQIRLEPEVVSNIGVIISRYTRKFPINNFFMDFDDTLEWDDGDFGDGDSCFWSSNIAARRHMQDNGYFAVRIWQQYRDWQTNLFGGLCGVGRAWIRPRFPNSSTMLLFNAYGPLDRDQLSLAICTVFENCSFRSVSISNNGDTRGMMYLNNGRGTLISTDKGILNGCDGHLDLHARVYDMPSCVSCDDEIDVEDELYYQDNNGDYICEWCRNNHYFQCSVCKDLVSNRYTHETSAENPILLYRVTNWRSFSDFPENPTFEVSRHTEICRHCFQHSVRECPECKRMYRTESLYAQSNWTRCEVCPECEGIYNA